MLGRPSLDASVSGHPPGAAARSWRARLRVGLARAATTLALWPSRARERRALADLADAAEESPHLLRDIGVSRGEAREESAKPFWRP